MTKQTYGGGLGWVQICSRASCHWVCMTIKIWQLGVSKMKCSCSVHLSRKWSPPLQDVVIDALFHKTSCLRCEGTCLNEHVPLLLFFLMLNWRLIWHEFDIVVFTKKQTSKKKKGGGRRFGRQQAGNKKSINTREAMHCRVLLVVYSCCLDKICEYMTHTQRPNITISFSFPVQF